LSLIYELDGYPVCVATIYKSSQLPRLRRPSDDKNDEVASFYSIECDPDRSNELRCLAEGEIIL